MYIKQFCVIFFIFCVSTILSCSSGDTKKNAAGSYESFEINLLSGETFHSDSLAGKVVLVDYWATWCSPCIKEVPGYNMLYKKYKDENFVFLPICMDSGNADNIKPFIEEYGIEYPVYVGNSTVRNAFEYISAYPTTFVLNQNGKITDTYVGISPVKIEEIDRIIEKLLKE